MCRFGASAQFWAYVWARRAEVAEAAAVSVSVSWCVVAFVVCNVLNMCAFVRSHILGMVYGDGEGVLCADAISSCRRVYTRFFAV